MNSNTNLWEARFSAFDEFYTTRSVIEREMKHYKSHFKGKRVFCNCDDPDSSEFWKFFRRQFNNYEIRELIGTGYNGDGPTVARIYNGSEKEIILEDPGEGMKPGDFRSSKSIEFLKKADIVVTNPPFSRFREYVSQLMKYRKQFLIIGSTNAAHYEDIRPHIFDNKIWIGIDSGAKEYRVPKKWAKNNPKKISNKDEDGNYYSTMGNTWWFTNLTHRRQNLPLVLTHKFNPEKYPRYDEIDMIEVEKVVEIPRDYSNSMAVPISFLTKYCSNQFDLVDYYNNPVVNGEHSYARFVIKRRNMNDGN